MTALRELYEDMMLHGKVKIWDYYFEREKQQIMDGYDNGFSSGYDDAQGDGAIFENGEQYFAETYGSKESEI